MPVRRPQTVTVPEIPEPDRARALRVCTYFGIDANKVTNVVMRSEDEGKTLVEVTFVELVGSDVLSDPVQDAADAHADLPAVDQFAASRQPSGNTNLTAKPAGTYGVAMTPSKFTEPARLALTALMGLATDDHLVTLTRATAEGTGQWFASHLGIDPLNEDKGDVMRFDFVMPNGDGTWTSIVQVDLDDEDNAAFNITTEGHATLAEI